MRFYIALLLAIVCLIAKFTQLSPCQAFVIPQKKYWKTTALKQMREAVCGHLSDDGGLEVLKEYIRRHLLFLLHRGVSN